MAETKGVSSIIYIAINVYNNSLLFLLYWVQEHYE